MALRSRLAVWLRDISIRDATGSVEPKRSRPRDKDQINRPCRLFNSEKVSTDYDPSNARRNKPISTNFKALGLKINFINNHADIRKGIVSARYSKNLTVQEIMPAYDQEGIHLQPGEKYNIQCTYEPWQEVNRTFLECPHFFNPISFLFFLIFFTTAHNYIFGWPYDFSNLCCRLESRILDFC